MPAPPLTHHDILRLASPLSSRGLSVDMARSDRSERYIEFKAQQSFSPLISCVHSVQLGTERRHQLSRVLIHASGLVATLEAATTDLEKTLDAFDTIPQEHQMQCQDGLLIALSYSLRSIREDHDNNVETRLQYACCHAGGLELRVDTSTGGAMPADVRVILGRQIAAYLPEKLASGEDLPLLHRAARRNATDVHNAVTVKPQVDIDVANHSPTVTRLPEDFLAVLGAQWRPLRYQGDHWKGVLRTLGSEPSRTPRAEKYVLQAVEHLHQSLHEAPANYHERLHRERWKVYFRRLQPLMVFLAILAMMPLSWLLVSRGEMAMHPLALGLTPLLMVGVVVITAREIPVMEIPAKPAPIPDHYWATGTGKIDT